MSLITILLIVVGLSIFEIISSIDNAIINAEVLQTMKEKSRRFFLSWGLLFSVVLVRGLLPWFILWISNPALGPIQALIAAFSNDPRTTELIEESAPLLLLAGGIFLIFVFLHWLFMEDKHYGLRGELFFHKQGVWFYAVVSIILTIIVWYAVQTNPILALSAVIGSTAFFIIHGFRQNAEMQEQALLEKGRADLSKLLYLELIDATFSIDGVLGAFAFTFSIPLILLGNGLGAVVLRQLTISNIENIKKYRYLKNGAMYSILFLGLIMVLDSLGSHIPSWFSPITTLGIVAYFFNKSRLELRKENVQM